MPVLLLLLWLALLLFVFVNFPHSFSSWWCFSVSWLSTVSLDFVIKINGHIFRVVLLFRFRFMFCCSFVCLFVFFLMATNVNHYTMMNVCMRTHVRKNKRLDIKIPIHTQSYQSTKIPNNTWTSGKHLLIKIRQGKWIHPCKRLWTIDLTN